MHFIRWHTSLTLLLQPHGYHSPGETQERLAIDYTFAVLSTAMPFRLAYEQEVAKTLTLTTNMP